MKRIGLFFVTFLLVCLLFAVSVWAKDVDTVANSAQDIIGAVAGAESGDTLNITLGDDIELSETVESINSAIAFWRGTGIVSECDGTVRLKDNTAFEEFAKSRKLV